MEKEMSRLFLSPKRLLEQELFFPKVALAISKSGEQCCRERQSKPSA